MYMYKRYIKNTAWASSAPVPPSLTSFGHIYIAMAETNRLPRSASKQNLMSRTVFSRTFSIVLRPSRDIPACSRPFPCVFSHSHPFRLLPLSSDLPRHPSFPRFPSIPVYIFVPTHFLSIFHIRIRP